MRMERGLFVVIQWERAESLEEEGKGKRVSWEVRDEEGKKIKELKFKKEKEKIKKERMRKTSYLTSRCVTFVLFYLLPFFFPDLTLMCLWWPRLIEIKITGLFLLPNYRNAIFFSEFFRGVASRALNIAWAPRL